jgi:hypothetical protein
MAKPKPGDKRGWNEKTGTGYKWEVRNGKGKWVQYKNNKRHGPFKGHGGITGNVDVVGILTSRIKNAPKRWKDRITKPIKWINKKSAEAKVKRDKLKVEKAKNKEVLERAKENLNKPKEVKKDVKPKSSKKDNKKMHRIERQNRERFGDAHVDKLKAKHKAWKEARRNRKKLKT